MYAAVPTAMPTHAVVIAADVFLFIEVPPVVLLCKIWIVSLVCPDLRKVPCQFFDHFESFYDFYIDRLIPPAVFVSFGRTLILQE